jgi:hypothetical protein
MIPIETVQKLQRLLGKDKKTEDMVVNFISAKWGAKNLARITEKQAEAIINRPQAFLKACEEVWRDDVPF